MKEMRKVEGSAVVRPADNQQASETWIRKRRRSTGRLIRIEEETAGNRSGEVVRWLCAVVVSYLNQPLPLHGRDVKHISLVRFDKRCSKWCWNDILAPPCGSALSCPNRRVWEHASEISRSPRDVPRSSAPLGRESAGRYTVTRMFLHKRGVLILGRPSPCTTAASAFRVRCING